MSQSGSWFVGSGPGAVVETLTGNTGGPIGPTGSNINIIGTGNISVSGNPADSTLTISEVTPSTIMFDGNTGSAVPVGGVISLLGGTNITSTASGSQVVFNLTGIVPIVLGGTGNNSFVPYSVVTGGITATSPLQSVASIGTTGQVLTSNGASTLPTWQNNAGSTAIQTIDGNSGSISGTTVTVEGGNNITTSGSVATMTVSVSGTTNHAVQVGNATGSLTSVAVGTTGQVLTGVTGGSPTFQSPASSSITLTGDTGGALTGSSFTIYADTIGQNSGSSVSISGSGTTLKLNVTDANQNTIIGEGAGNSSLSGTENTGVGRVVFTSLTSGSENTAMGWEAAQTLAGGSHNVAIGTGALNNSSSDSNNTACGSSALLNLAGGSNNTAIGEGSLGQLATGADNTCLGFSSGSSYTTSESSNICIGYGVGGTIAESHVLRIGNATGTSTGNLAAAYICGISGVNVGSVATIVTEASNQLGTTVLTAGTGITITPTANVITISSTGNGLTWYDVTGGSATVAAQSGYIADSGSLTTFTMPTNNSIGDTIYIVGKGSGGWKIVYGAGQNIIFGSSATTATTGNLASTNANDCCTLVCTTASVTAPIFTVITSIGNLAVT